MRGNRHLGWQVSWLIEETNSILPKPNNLQKLHNKTEKRTSNKVGDKNLIQNLNLLKSKIFFLPESCAAKPLWFGRSEWIHSEQAVKACLRALEVRLWRIGTISHPNQWTQTNNFGAFYFCIKN
jgi:hypothetical protein